MKIKTLKKYAGGMALLTLLGLLPASCIKDDTAAVKETTLTLTFSTRASGDQGTTGPESANEHMRTLRVILAQQDGTIRYNTQITDIPEEATDQKVTFSELITVEDGTTTFDVYAIANEEAFVTSEQLDAQSGNISDMNLESLTLNAAVLQKLNQGLESDNQDKQEYRLPQTAKAEVEVIPGQENTAPPIQLEFVVAKVDLTFTNQSPQDIELGNVTFSHMSVAETPLFSGSSFSSGNDFNLGTVRVSGTTSENRVFYVYESQLSEGESYVLSSDWGNNSLDLTAEGLGNTFERGTKLKVNVTLNAQEITDFELLVLPWNEINIEVPPFE
jgi:hypothetical protein